MPTAAAKRGEPHHWESFFRMFPGDQGKLVVYDREEATVRRISGPQDVAENLEY